MTHDEFEDEFQTYMLVVAHPDDSEFSSAGTVARLKDAGKRVVLIQVTSGDKGSQDATIDPAELGRIREAEMLEAARRLGMDEVVFLRCPDGALMPDLELREKIVRTIRQHKPDVIITHDPFRPYALHPDHRAVGLATTDAVYPTARDPLYFPDHLQEGLAAAQDRRDLVLWRRASRQDRRHYERLRPQDRRPARPRHPGGDGGGARAPHEGPRTGGRRKTGVRVGRGLQGRPDAPLARQSHRITPRGNHMDAFAGTTAGEGVRRAIAAGRDAFGPTWAPDCIAIAPGRIELLGNHVDYNGGPVLAAAIDRFIAVATGSLDARDDALQIIAADVSSPALASLNADMLAGWRNPSPPPGPADYARGLLAALHERPSLTPRLPAAAAIAGDVPIGFGVSSSAALCVGLALALAGGFTAPEEVVLLAQEAEHRAGTPCGTMDQSASVAGGVIAFDGATLSVDRLSPALGDHVFVVADSGVERSLSSSSYPKRVAESRAALELARTALGCEIPHLAALTLSQLEELEGRRALPPLLAKRARHVVEETARVGAGRAAMQAGDWPHFGRLMTASGRSSATLYEISHPRVEELVATALTVPGVLGARMMGGGEGGAALILLSKDAVPRLEAALRSGYYARYGLGGRAGLLHVCAFAPGATVISGQALSAFV